jgi:polyphenol oxidase
MHTLATPPGIAAFYSEVSDGNMSLTHGNIQESPDRRRRLCVAAGIDPGSLVCPQQVHGEHIARVNASDRGAGVESVETALSGTDALICDTPGVACAVQTADCLAVFLHDPVSHSVAIVHAGWRSTRLQLTAKAVAAMQEKVQAKPASIHAWFGPALGSCCYEVGEEFADFFPEDAVRRQGRLHFDNLAANRRQLLACGLFPANIGEPGPCTACHPQRFFSHRRQGAQAGRMLSVIQIV